MRIQRGSLDGGGRLWAPLGAIGISAVAAAMGWANWPLTWVCLAALVVYLTGRWGILAGTAGALIAWCAGTLFLAVAVPFTTFAYQPVYVIVTAAASAVLVFESRRLAPARVPRRLPWPAIAAASTGAVVWLVSVIAARLLPGGSGHSWAVYDDSSLDVWAVSRILDSGGVTPLGIATPRPLEHILSSSFLPLDTVLDGSGASVKAMIDAHAAHWTLMVIAGCVLAGLTGAEIVRRLTNASTATIATTGAVTSSVLLLGPATGFFMYRGQINGSVAVALVLACAAFMIAPPISARTAVQLSIVTMTLVMVLWTPFAAVPGLFALVYGTQHRVEVLTRAHFMSLRFLGVMGAFLWCFAIFTADQLLDLSQRSDESLQAAVAVETYLPAPMSWWMVGALTATLAIGVWCAKSRDAQVAVMLVVVLGGICLGAVPIFGARGGFSGELEYYASRYVHMSEVMVAPLAIGTVVAVVIAGTWLVRGAITACVALAAGATVAAGPQEHVERWRPVPLLVIAGDYYGSDSVMYERIVEFADDPGLRLPWRLDEPYDTWARRMLSIDLEDRPTVWDWPLRGALRKDISDDPARICDIARSTGMQVTIVTRDPELESIATAGCPEGVVKRLTFAVVP